VPSQHPEAGVSIISFDIILEEYLHDIDESPLLSIDEEIDLARRINLNNDAEAREKLAKSNLRLVVNIAKKFANRGLPLSDLIEEGNLGLLRAIDSYDLGHGVRFSTYAAWWIKQSIKKALQTTAQPIHVPGYMVELIQQWRKACSDLQNKLGRDPRIEEIAKELQLPLKKAKIVSEIAETISAGFAGDSLDENQTLGDTIEDVRLSESQEALLNFEEMKKAVHLLDSLEGREAQVLTMHFGLDGSEPLTLKEIGKKLGLTRERVRQIQRDALRRLNELMAV
jgi:RNA polymerase primary sigma factor